jgi:hypothetical protein
VFQRQIQSAINEGRLKFQEMQVDTEPFPVNMIDFEGKRVLIWPSTADKGKGKEIIIGDTREANENSKISCRKVVAEKTLDGGETLKVTITTSGTGGQAQTRGQAREPLLRITDRPTPRRGRSEASSDVPKHSNGHSGNTQDLQRLRTFKPRRPEIGTWKTNTFKAAGPLVKSGPTFDQLLSKYVKKKFGPSDRPAKRPCSPAHERQQVRPIGTTDVVIHENNEGSMIFGDSANTTKKEDMAAIKIANPKYSMPIGIDTVPKLKITAPKSEGEPGKGGRKVI